MRALSRVQIIRPGGETLEITGLTSAAFSLSLGTYRGDGIAASGVVWDRQGVDLLSWSLQAESNAAPASDIYQAAKGAHRALELCVVAGTAGDRLTYYGPALITALSRGGASGGAWAWSMQAESAAGLEILPAPLNLRITAETATSVTLAWDAVDAAEYGAVDGYIVHASMTRGRPYEWTDDVGTATTATVNKTDGMHYVVTAYRVI